MAETYGRFLQEHRACLTPPCQAVLAPSTSGGIGSPFVLLPCYPISVAKWVTVTVTDPDGRRHSLDVQASTFDAAHLYVAEAKRERAVGLPKPSMATVFEVVTDGKVYRVKGEALQRWIVERRQKGQGPKGPGRSAPQGACQNLGA